MLDEEEVSDPGEGGAGTSTTRPRNESFSLNGIADLSAFLTQSESISKLRSMSPGLEMLSNKRCIRDREPLNGVPQA